MNKIIKKNKFIEQLAEFGLVLNNDDETFNVLNVNQRTFQSNLKKYFQENDENLNNFKAFIQEYFDKEINFLIALLPSQNNPETVFSHSSNQDNLLKLLIEIESLQIDLFQYLIEKIICYCEEDSELSSNDRKILGLDLNVPTYIINQFRYQPKIFQPDEVCKKLMELITTISSKQIKKDIILCFPDILSDSNVSHDSIVNELKELLSDNDLLSSVLETMSNLKFQSVNTISIIDDLFLKYDFIDEADAPFAIKFILKSSSNLNSKDILKNLLNRVKFNELKIETNRLLAFNVFREYFQISTNLIELYYTILTQNLTDVLTDSSNNANTEILKTIDFMIITILYSFPQQYKTIDKLFKQILKEDFILNVEKSIKATFQLGESILKELFKPIAQVAKSLIDHPISQIFSVGQLVYKIGFEYFNKHQRHSLIKILIENITCSNGTARSFSCDNYLDVLIDLCSLKLRSNTTQNSFNNPLVLYSMEIKVLLDFIEYFSLGQIRKVYFIICSIAYSNQTSTSTINTSKTALPSSSFQPNYHGDGNSRADFSLVSNNTLQDNLHILINKQLSSNALKYKQIGVIGALMMIENMAKKLANSTRKSNPDDSDEFLSCSSTENSQNNESLSVSNIMFDSNVSTEIKQIWNMIIESSKSSPESLGLFEDDLTSLLRKDSIPENLENLIKLNLETMTRSLFKIDPKLQDKFNSVSFKIDYDFGLVEATNGALNLFPRLMSDMQKKNASLFENSSTREKQSVPSITICSTFRLFAALERKNVLVLIDYLGCPILTVKKDFLYSYGNFIEGFDINISYNSPGNALSNSLSKFKNVLNSEERKIICDSLFFMISWFTELINAFSLLIKQEEIIEKDQNDLNNKLVSRLSTIIELHQILANLLPHMKHYRPPIAVFGMVDTDTNDLPFIDSLFKAPVKKSLTTSKKSKKSMKKTKKPMNKKQKMNKENDDETINENDQTCDEEDYEEKEIVNDSEEEELLSLENKNYDVEACMNKISSYLREFDIGLLKFVELDLNLEPGLVPDTGSRSNESIINNSIARINPNLLYFVLNDVNKKLAIILKPKSTSKLLGFPSKPNKIQLFLQLNNIDPKETATFLLENCWEKLCNHLDNIFKYIRAIQLKNVNLKDPAEIQNNPKNICLLRCVNQILRLMHILFVWLNSSNEPFFSNKIQESIKKLGSKLELTKKGNVIATQIDKAAEIFGYKYLSNLREICLDIYTSDVLAQLMDLICNKIFLKHFHLNDDMKKKCRLLLSETCKIFLKSEFNPKLASKQTTTSNESVFNILNILLKNNENPIEIVNDLAKIITSDDFREDRQSCGDFETLKTNFTSYFKVLLEYTVNNLNFEILKNYDLKRCGLDDLILDELLQKIICLVDVHCNLIYLKRHISFKDINILTLIKNSRLFINNFLKFSMPVLDKAFDKFKAEVVTLLQKLQKCVHFLQEMCLAKNQFSISKQMPVYARCIEAFLLRVKQLLYVNSCDGAFIVDFNKFKLTEQTKKKTADKKILKEKGQNKNKGPKEKITEETVDEETISDNEDDTKNENNEEEEEEEEDLTESDDE